MITRDNLSDIINMMDRSDIKKIRNSYKKFVVLYLYACNAFSFVNVTLTNDYNRYKNVSNNGNCILDLDDVLNLINGRTDNNE